MYQFFQLSMERLKAYRPVMPELQKSGLGKVFQDGETLLKNARSTLDGGAIIGFMAYTPLASDKYEFGSPRYLRYCVTSTEIQLLDLGTKADIDNSIFNWRQLILTGQPTSKIGGSLYRALLEDLPSSVNAAKRWTIEPDGVLNLLPFEALPTPDGRLLVTAVNVGYVTSFGQIRPPSLAVSSGKARIIADPDFSNASNREDRPHNANYRVTATVVSKGRGIESMVVPSLPETRREATAVGKSLDKLGFQSEYFLGNRADIHSFEMSESPRILHVATHGILIAPTPLPEQSQVDTLVQAESIIIALPGRNAGLAVAGKGKPEIIYASDIARLPLQNTELVVLSACDTGNGTVDVGEGMASLRRSVESAGAAASITSLWSVPSAKTTELMASFYGYLAKGNGKRASLRMAKLDAIAKDPNPYHWAGFVFAGQE
jgi:CHAT domain-containing protein